MDVESIEQPEPKLSDFLTQFSDCGSSEIQARIRPCVSGQVSLIDRKNVEQIALHAGQVPRTLQGFLELCARRLPLSDRRGYFSKLVGRSCPLSRREDT